MTKKIFVICLAILFALQGAAAAKSKKKIPEIPLEERVKISVEVLDKTSFQELDTAEILRGMIEEQLEMTGLFDIIGAEGSNFLNLKTLGEKKSSSDVGELLYFNLAEVSYGAGTDADIFSENYTSQGIDYLVKCQILGLGTTQETSEVYNPGFGIGIGSRGHGHFGIGIYNPIGIGTRKRTIYCTAVNVQFIKTDTAVVLWQRNLVGQAVLHRKPSKGYDDASDEAYLKSIKDASETIVERTEKYSANFLIEKNDSELEKK